MNGVEHWTRAKSECSMSKTQKFSKRNAKKCSSNEKKKVCLPSNSYGRGCRRVAVVEKQKKGL